MDDHVHESDIDEAVEGNDSPLEKSSQHNLNASIASVEELIPDLPQTSSTLPNHLNSQVQTSQQLLLML